MSTHKTTGRTMQQTTNGRVVPASASTAPSLVNRRSSGCCETSKAMAAGTDTASASVSVRRSTALTWCTLPLVHVV